MNRTINRLKFPATVALFNLWIRRASYFLFFVSTSTLRNSMTFIFGKNSLTKWTALRIPSLRAFEVFVPCIVDSETITFSHCLDFDCKRRCKNPNWSWLAAAARQINFRWVCNKKKKKKNGKKIAIQVQKMLKGRREGRQAIHSEIQSLWRILHDSFRLNGWAHVSKSFQFLVSCYGCFKPSISYSCNLNVDNNANPCEYWFDERWICFDIKDTIFSHGNTCISSETSLHNSEMRLHMLHCYSVTIWKRIGRNLYMQATHFKKVGPKISIDYIEFIVIYYLSCKHLPIKIVHFSRLLWR